MRKSDQQGPLDPIEQESILFHNEQIIAVKLVDGRICAVLRWVCESLHLDSHAQVRRIQRTSTIANELVRVRVRTEGGKQVMPAITLRGFSAWILGVNPNEVRSNNPSEDEHLRELIIAYQEEAKDALYQHFLNKGRSALPEPRTAIVQSMEDPGPMAGHEERTTYHETMSLWHRWQADYHMQQWRKEVQEKQSRTVDEEKAMGSLIADIQDRMGPQRITPEQQALVQYYVSELSKATNKSHQTIFASLKTAFRVPRYDEIPASRWQEVEQWFKRQMPGQELPPTQEKLF